MGYTLYMIETYESSNVNFSVYVNGNFLCTGNEGTCDRIAKEFAAVNHKVEIVYMNNRLVRTYVMGEIVTRSKV